MQNPIDSLKQATDPVIQATLAGALQNPSAYPHPVNQVDMLETHISYVFLAGPYAYKVKKAVELGFLDFRSLKARAFYCEEELRLNRRLAPSLYLDVVAITGSPSRPIIGGNGPPIEYAVKMHRFSQDELLDHLLSGNQLTSAHVDELAQKIARFHASISVASTSDAFGTAEAVQQPALENFSQLRDTGCNSPDLNTLEDWTKDQCKNLRQTFNQRKENGFVRECHGDFHLGNIALVQGEVTMFDCLEFNANLRWIDVMNEAAFLVMDLQDRQRSDLAQRFLNRYLEITGDYAGLQVLRFYIVYRAIVRAKIHWLRANQSDVNAARKADLLAQHRDYIALAKNHIYDSKPAIIITHGLSGSGKTTASQSLVLSQ